MPSAKVTIQAIRSALWLALCALAVGVYVSQSKAPLAEQIQKAVGPTVQTAFPARIGPNTQTALVSEAAAQVESVHRRAGDLVEAGDLLVVLESPELSSQADVARIRLEAAAAHLEAARAVNNTKRNHALLREQMRIAERGRDMARQRLDALRVAELEQALKQADTRLVEIQSLVKSGLATDSEFRAFQTHRDNAESELASLLEHRSRLMQEVAVGESRVRILELQSLDAPEASATAEADYADAKSAFEALQQRLDSLRVIAPSRGTLLSVSVQQGERVTPGAVLARIADLDKLAISAPVTASVARRIHVGRRVTVLLPGEPPQRTSATVDEVSLAPDSIQQAYLVKTVIPNPDPGVVLVGLEAQLEFDGMDAL
jgi:multidrug efflux pump subunit AcrA (membrane-fusion protein)